MDTIATVRYEAKYTLSMRKCVLVRLKANPPVWAGRVFHAVIGVLVSLFVSLFEFQLFQSYDLHLENKVTCSTQL